MILTVTCNPSLDYIYFLDTLKVGQHNRVKNPEVVVGGKGINSGRVSAHLGSLVALTGFLGGEIGQIIYGKLKKEHIYTKIDFLKHSEANRNAITIMDSKKQQTEIVEEGISLSKTDYQNLVLKIKELINEYPGLKVICFSGTANYKDCIYVDLINEIKNLKPDIKFIADIANQQLHSILENKIPLAFIKPNMQEFIDLIGENITTTEEIIAHLNKSLFDNIETIMVSLGSSGAIVKHHKKFYQISIPKIEVVNPTGSGDSTVGGFAYALENDFSIKDCLKLATACGMSNAASAGVGDVNKLQIETFLPKIKITEIK